MKGTLLTLLCAITFAQGREFFIGNRRLCICNPSDSYDICANWDREDIVIAHERCDKFYKCAYGKPVPYCCPQGTVFNIEKEQCDWSANVQCGDRFLVSNNDNDCLQNNGDNDNSDDNEDNDIVGPCNCDPSEAPSICKAQESEGVLIAHEYCNHFYICNHGKPVSMRCGPNTLYNPYTQRCEWAQNIECGNRIIPDNDDSNDSDVDDGDNGNNQKPCNCNPAEAPEICAGKGSDGILVAHENCDQFYQCNHGKPFPITCPDNTLYNPYVEQCDWPRNVDCGDRIAPNCTCECGQCNEGNEGNDDITEGDCNDSVVGGGSGSDQDGGSGGGGVSEEGGGGGSTCNCNPVEAPNICAQDGSNGVLIAHENCNQFYKCSFGKPVSLICPSGLLYNPYTEQCDWPNNVDCADRVIPDSDSGAGGGGVSGEGDCSEEGGDTGGGGGSGEGDTPGGGGGGSTCNCNPSEAPNICAQDGSNGVLIAHENCNQFYKCSYGKPVALICPSGLLYNPYTEQCDWPHNVECGDRVIPDSDSGAGEGGGPGEEGDSGVGGGSEEGGAPGGGGGGSTCNCNPAEAPNICAQDGSNGVLITHENCNQFYKCSYGKPVALICPSGLLYNPYTEQCDWPHNVECGDRVIPDSDSGAGGGGGSEEGDCPEEGDSGVGGGSEEVGAPGGGGGGSTCNCNPAEAPNICAQDESNGVLIAHENCNQFYKCSYGKPVALICPSGLLYNPYTEQCDWPHNVECGDRVIPDSDSGAGGGGGSEEGDCPEEGDSGVGGGSEEGGAPGGGGGGSTCNCNPAEAPNICVQDGSNGVLIAHENCNQFYKCSYGKPVALICPSGLLYNPYTEQCDWPHNVECGDRVIPDSESGAGGGGGSEEGDCPEEGDSGVGGGSEEGGAPGGGGGGSTCNCNPAEAPNICAQDGSNGVLIAHENCNQFYKCSYGKPVALICPSGLLYNPYTEQCDWPHNVECGDRVIPDSDSGAGGGGGSEEGDCPEEGDSGVGGGSEEGGAPGGGGGGSTCNCIPAEAPNICAQDGSNGVLIAHENCNQFYKCSYGKPVALICPSGLLYNPYTEQCDWPHNVECGDRVIPDSDSGAGEGGGPGEEGDSGVGGGSEEGGAPGGGGGGSTCNCIPAEAPNICAQDGSNGVLIAHENCNQFYKCSYGKPVALICPSGLLYNPYTEQCDWPHNVECGDRVIPDSDSGAGGGGGSEEGDCPEEGDSGVGGGSEEGGAPGGGGGGSTCNCIPAEAPNICAQDGSNGVLIAHENCNQFYKCSYGKPVALICPSGLLYNPYTEQCDWPHNVECGDRVIPDSDSGAGEGGGPGEEGDSGVGGGSEEGGAPGGGGGGSTCNCNPAEAPNICAQDGSNGVLIAHENCNQFYKCSYGKPVALNCPSGLLYNPYTEQCDWPHNVECGDRVIPDSDSGAGEGGGSGEGDCSEEGDSGVGGGSEEGGAPGGGGGGSTCNCNPAEAPNICAQDGSNGVLIAHENCNQFYKCSYGKPVALICPSGLLYNPYTEQCDWPHNVECGDRVIPDSDSGAGEDGSPGEGGDTGNGGGSGDGGGSGGGDGGSTCNCNPAEAPNICAQDESNGLLIAHENCNQFYKCSYGKPVALICPSGLLYNPYTEQCDWSDNVNCGDRVICEETEIDEGNDNGSEGSGDNNCHDNPSLAPEVCAAPDSNGILVAHQQCDKFYMCTGGRPVVVSCPSDMPLFNPNIRACDETANVQCGDRIIPDKNDSEEDCKCKFTGATLCDSPALHGMLIPHENCNQFYTCVHGSAVVHSCPNGLFYDPRKQACEWPLFIDCEGRTTPLSFSSLNKHSEARYRFTV